MSKTAITITDTTLASFFGWLCGEDRSRGTIEKYLRDIRTLREWLNGRPLNQENGAKWKDSLLEKGYRPASVNSMLAAVNTFCRFAGVNCKLRFLRIQRRVFREEKKNLTRCEFERLVTTARNEGKDRLALLLETIAGTGIRVSETKYITVEAARNGQVQVSLKGKIRVILLPGKLCKFLLRYAKDEGIAEGPIFTARNGTPLSRKTIWAEMKSLCRKAKVAAGKVFPHNLRHLFARLFYKASKDIAKLADVLGHSSIETTRIYLVSTGEEHVRQLERMKLVE